MSDIFGDFMIEQAAKRSAEGERLQAELVEVTRERDALQAENDDLKKANGQIFLQGESMFRERNALQAVVDELEPIVAIVASAHSAIPSHEAGPFVVTFARETIEAARRLAKVK